MSKAAARTAGWIERVARIAFTFVVMNCCAVAALPALALRKRVWR
jgi:hypothetical protein